MPRLPRPRLRRPRLPRPRTLGGRLRAGLDFVFDVGWIIRGRLRRAAAALGRDRGALRGAWMRRSLSFRRRSAAVALVLALYAVLTLVALPGVPCSVSAAKDCPPTDDAITLIPADAHAYLHLYLDPSETQVERALELTERLPLLTRAAGTVLARTYGLRSPENVLDEVPSFLGDELAFAEIPLPDGEPALLAVAEVTDHDRAGRFLAAVSGVGRPAGRQHRTTPIDCYGPLCLAQLGGFAVAGSEEAVRAAIDVRRRGSDSLDESPLADEVRSGLPDDRLADAYVSADGIRELAGRGGLVSQLDTFADFGASRGIAAALVAHEDGLQLELDSRLDPEEVKASPGFFAAFPRFVPGLAAELPEDTVAYLGIADPGETAKLLLEQADAAAPGIAAAFARFNRDLRRGGGVDLERGLLPLLDGEGAVAATPGRPLPFLTLIFDGVDESRVRATVAQLGGALIGAARPGQTGQAPSLGEERIGDVVAHTVRLSQTLAVSYAVFDDKLVLSTDLTGVREAIEGERHLSDSPQFGTVAEGGGAAVSALVFLNLEGLVKLAEPRGLAEIAPYATFKPDIAKLKALGVTVSSGEDSLQTRAFLEIK